MPRTLLLLLPMLLAACGAEPGAPPAPAPEAAPRLDFPAKARMPVSLHMHAPEEGGREVAIGGAWRGEVEFDGGDRARCGIERGLLSELVPGGRYEVHLVCGGAVRLGEGGGRGFRITEDGRTIASGDVLP